MRLITTKTAIAIGLFATFVPHIASAVETPSFSCSANLVVSLDNGYNASCAGDFLFTDGVLQNDISISLTAIGLLTIGTNASLFAPMITLAADSLQIFGNVVSTAPSTTLIADSKEVILKAPTIQNDPKSTLNWQQLQILPGREIYVGGDITTNSTQTEPVPVITSVGGSILLGSNSGLIINSGTSGSALITLVPEPSAYMMMILGLIPLGFMSKRKAV